MQKDNQNKPDHAVVRGNVGPNVVPAVAPANVDHREAPAPKGESVEDRDKRRAERRDAIKDLQKRAADLGLTVGGLPAEGVTSAGVILQQPGPYITRAEFAGERPGGLTPEEKAKNDAAIADADQKEDTRRESSQFDAKTSVGKTRN